MPPTQIYEDPKKTFSKKTLYEINVYLCILKKEVNYMSEQTMH